MRQISFSLTKGPVRRRTKTVTRRLGWRTLKVGEVLQGIEQGQGLKAGARGIPICQVRIIDVRREPLGAILDEPNGCAREGFPEMSPAAFIRMFCQTHPPCQPETEITRIELAYVTEAGR